MTTVTQANTHKIIDAVWEYKKDIEERLANIEQELENIQAQIMIGEVNRIYFNNQYIIPEKQLLTHPNPRLIQLVIAFQQKLMVILTNASIAQLQSQGIYNLKHLGESYLDKLSQLHLPQEYYPQSSKLTMESLHKFLKNLKSDYNVMAHTGFKKMPPAELVEWINQSSSLTEYNQESLVFVVKASEKLSNLRNEDIFDVPS